MKARIGQISRLLKEHSLPVNAGCRMLNAKLIEIQRSAFDVWHRIRHSAFGIQHSAFGIDIQAARFSAAS
jgi:hypothetical protein